MSIHPYLLARLYAIQTAFEQTGFRSAPTVATSTPNGNPKPIANSTSIWDDLLKDSDGDKGSSDGDSGGGTMKGLRGKNHISAMRRLSR